MLKCVVFAVTEYGFHYLERYRDSIEEILDAGGVKTLFLQYKEDIDYMERTLRDINRGEDSCFKEEALYITDDATGLKYLLKQNCYVIALYHDQNRDASFADALYVVDNVEELTLKAYDEVYRRLAGIPWDILETQRLKVRESTVADVKDFYRIYREPSITYYMEDLFQDPDEENAYMESYIRQIYGFYGFGMWTVLLKSTGQVIGRAGLSIREGYDLPELGFVIDVPHQGRGYALEICGAILTYAKDELCFAQVQALVQKENEASLNLLKKLGFRYEKNVVEKGQEYLLMIRNLQ